MNIPGLPPIISSTLAAFALGERRVRVLRGLGESLVVYLGGLGAVALLDATLKPGHGWHWTLSLTVYGLTGAMVVARVVLPFLRKPTDAEIAHAIESRIDDKLEEQLSSAVELAGRNDPGVSAWMVERTVALGAQQVADLDVSALVDRQPAQRAWKRAGVVLATIAAACIIPGAGSYLARAALPALLRPAQVAITVLPGDQHLALGSALEITIATTPDPGAARLALTWDDGVDEAIEFTSIGEGRYAARIPAVTNALKYRVTAGDGESAAYRVTVARPPVLGDLALRITPPAYSGLPARDITGGDAEVLAGSNVTLTAKLDGAPAIGGALVFDGGEHAATIKDGMLSVELKPNATVAYGLRLVGDGGLIAQSAQRWILSVRPDVPPVVQLAANGLDGGLVGDDEALVLNAAARDDLGLRGAELVVTVDGSERQVRPLPLPEGTRTEASLPVALDLAALKVKEGEELALAARVTDLGGQRTLSEPVKLVVTSTADARGAAQAKRLRLALVEVDAQYEALRTLVRTWGQIARQDDAGARQGELALMANRIGVWREALGEVSASLIEEASDGAVATARPLMNLAGEYRGWSRGAGAMLETACSDGRNDAKELGRGRDLGEAALSDLAALRHDLALIIARLEAGGLAAATEAAHARYQRAAPIVRGDRGWRGSDGWRSGLLGEFRQWQDFNGPVKYREIALPVWRNRDVPGLGRENFCVRYRGEINIPVRGEWEFAAGADDGVRLRVAGRQLTPDNAWTPQGYTEYRGKILLEAGWHPLELESFQGASESGLGLSFAPAGKPLRQVRESDVRCLPARGAAGWKPGLMAQFRQGKDFNGQVRFQEAGNPNWKDRDIPGLGRENFCVRWQGEIRIPADGEWDVTVGGNDGVRARIADQDATPPDAFESHSYKEFKRTLRLSAGWHPIAIELYQLGGNNGIGLALAPKGKQPQPVTDADLRWSDTTSQPVDETNDGSLVRAMASLPTSQVKAAQERLRAALELIAEVPKQIGELGTLAANEELARVARERGEDGKALAAALAGLDKWDLPALADADRRGEAIARIAAHARNVVNGQVERELRERVEMSDLAVLRQATSRINDRVRALRQIPDSLPQSDRAMRWRVETTAGRAWIAFIGDEAFKLRRSYLDVARRSGATLATRSSALHIARRLDVLSGRVEEVLAAVRDLPNENHPAADRLSQQAERLNQVLYELGHWERTHQMHELGERAAPLVAELRVLEPLRREDPEMARGRWELAVSATRAITRRARQGHHADKAEQIDKLLAKWSDDVKPEELANRLNEFAQQNDGWHDHLDHLTAEQLAESAKRLGQAAQNLRVVEHTVVDLDEARLAEAVEGEYRFVRNKDPIAKGFIALAADIGVVVDTSVTPTPPMVQAFAERAFALINQRGEEAKKQEIAKAEKRETDTEESKKLDALAEELAKAADKQEERAAALAKLEELAKEAEQAKQEQQEADLAKELQELLREQNALAAEELAARRAFAEAERKLAQQLPKIAEQAQQAAQKTTGELAKALKEASAEAPQTAKELADLAREAVARAPESAQPENANAEQQLAANDPQAPQNGQQAERQQGQQPQDQQGRPQPQNQQGQQPQSAQNPQGQQQQAQNQPQDGQQAQNQPGQQQAQDGQKQDQQGQQQARNSQRPQDQQQNGQQNQQGQQQAQDQQGQQQQDGQQPEAAASTAELVARAHAAADQLEQGIAQPLAEKFQQASENGDPSAQAAAEVGRQVAEAAAEQRAAADRLAAVLEQQAENREELASALQQAAAMEQSDSAQQGGEKQSAAERKAEQAQSQADKAQAQADKAQAQADKAQAQAESAAANAQQGDGDQQARQQAQQQAAQAAQNAANAQAEAVAAQERALDAQVAALEAAAAAGSSQEHLAEAIDNLAQAQRNSLDALDNHAESASGQAKTAEQAGENLERAAEALSKLGAAANKAAGETAQELASNAAEAGAAEAQQGQDQEAQGQQAGQQQGQGQGQQQGQGKGEQAGQGESPSAASQAAASALASMQAGGDQRAALQQASRAMAAAAQQARLASSMGKGQGQGPSGQGENQGKAQSTGDPGSAAGMRRAPPGIDQADWARAQEKKRTDVGTVSIERFSEEHQEAIRAYLRRLGEGK